MYIQYIQKLSLVFSNETVLFIFYGHAEVHSNYCCSYQIKVIIHQLIVY